MENPLLSVQISIDAEGDGEMQINGRTFVLVDEGCSISMKLPEGVAGKDSSIAEIIGSALFGKLSDILMAMRGISTDDGESLWSEEIDEGLLERFYEDVY